MQVAARLLSALALCLVVALTAGLSACGFQLRTPPTMNFKTIQLTGFASNSPLAAELARAIEASGAQVVDTTLEAAQAASSATVPTSHIILESLRDTRDEAVASTTAYGQVRDMLARTHLRYRILRGDGSVIVPPTSLELANTLTFNEKDALAKADEYDALHRAMQTDIVNQVIRRLAALKPAQLVPPPAPAASGPVSAASQAAR
ncbi:MAG: LPS assembly lipoprotein LptE [Acidobacteriota bacterium]